MSSNNSSLQDLWNIIIVLNKDAESCGLAFSNTTPDNEDLLMFWGRMYAHAIFALLESTCYRLTYAAHLSRSRPEVFFSSEEIALLDQLCDNTNENYLHLEQSLASIKERIQFAFTAFARVNYSTYRIPVNSHQWSLLERALLLKNRLAYPCELAELQITPQEVELLGNMCVWFMSCISDMMESSLESLEQKLNEMDSNLNNNSEDELIM